MENYNPSNSVCDNQDDFNIAVKNANKYMINKKLDKNYSCVYFFILCIFVVWAVMIALKSSFNENSSRIVQLVFAIVFSPLYVISHYLSLLSTKNVSMGMCGCSK